MNVSGKEDQNNTRFEAIRRASRQRRWDICVVGDGRPASLPPSRIALVSVRDFNVVSSSNINSRYQTADILFPAADEHLLSLYIVSSVFKFLCYDASSGF